MAERPVQAEHFNNHMAGYKQGRARWMDPSRAPVKEILGKGASMDKDAVLMVDVGGGTGGDIDDFHKRYPNLPGRLILQDLPEVCKHVKGLSDRVEVIVHDFFTPQPIHGKI
jgi:hypothetical protein